MGDCRGIVRIVGNAVLSQCMDGMNGFTDNECTFELGMCGCMIWVFKAIG